MRTGSSSTLGEQRFSASVPNGGEPRRGDPGDDGRPPLAVAARGYVDPFWWERAGLRLSTLDGLTSWPGDGDGETVPGVVTLPALAAPLVEAREGGRHAQRRDAVEDAHRNDAPTGNSGEYALDTAIEAPAAASDGDPSASAESTQDAGRAGPSGDARSSLGAGNRARHRAALKRGVAAALGTRRWWALTAVGVAIGLIALTVAVTVHSHHSAVSADPRPSADATTGTPSQPDVLNVVPPYAGDTSTDPSAEASEPLPSDPWAAVLPEGPVPDAQLPGGPPMPNPQVPPAATSDPQLDQTQPAAPDQSLSTPAQNQAGAARPGGIRPDDAATPRRSDPLRGSLDSLIAPHRPNKSDHGGSGSQKRDKSLPGGLPELGAGL